MCNGFGLNNNNKIVKKSTFFSAKNLNHLDGINTNRNLNNLIPRESINLNKNNNVLNNLRTVYNINYPVQTGFIYYNNNTLNYNPDLINNRPQVSNFLIYYA